MWKWLLTHREKVQYRTDNVHYPRLKGGPKYERLLRHLKRLSMAVVGRRAIASVSADDVARAKDATLKAFRD